MHSWTIFARTLCQTTVSGQMSLNVQQVYMHVYIYMNAYRDDVSVPVIGQPVKEHTHALIPPNPDEAGDRVKPVRSGQAQPMIDT